MNFLAYLWTRCRKLNVRGAEHGVTGFMHESAGVERPCSKIFTPKDNGIRVISLSIIWRRLVSCSAFNTAYIVASNDKSGNFQGFCFQTGVKFCELMVWKHMVCQVANPTTAFLDIGNLKTMQLERLIYILLYFIRINTSGTPNAL